MLYHGVTWFGGRREVSCVEGRVGRGRRKTGERLEDDSMSVAGTGCATQLVY